MFFPPSARVHRARYAILAALVCATAGGSAAAPPRAEITAGALSGPGFSVAGIRIAFDLASPSRGEAVLRNLKLADRALGDVRLTCADLQLSKTGAECREGRLGAVPAQWRFDASRGEGWLRLAPGPDERWEVRVGTAGGTRAEMRVVSGRAERARDWLPTGWPVPNAGSIAGTAVYRRVAGASHVKADFTVDDLAFGDAAGLRAGEHIGGTMALTGDGDGGGVWSWDLALDWNKGAVFWDPLYVPGGIRLSGRGRIDAGTLQIGQFSVSLPGAVAVAGSADWDLEAHRLRGLEISAQAPDLGAAFQQWVAPSLTGGRWADASVGGVAEGEVSVADGELRRAALTLKDAELREPGTGMALSGASAQLKWRSDGAEAGSIGWRAGSVYGIPLGAAAVTLDVLPDGLTFAHAAVPVLDGELTLRGGRFSRTAGAWSWQVGGGLSAVSMEALTKRLNWPAMRGSLSGVVPRISYREKRLDVDGALLFRVFDGTVVVRNLQLEDPLGRAPRLAAEAEMRDLELDLVTRAFSFGSMEGRIDVDVRDLELSNWTPVRFDARIASSAGDYQRTISQRAVENISALGGAGAAAAIQRSLLRVFEQFRYRRLGLSCRMREGVCRMDGVAPAPQGYVIVEGGGVPAITVIGYNRNVGWNELIGRLKRITQSNVTPVVQ